MYNTQYAQGVHIVICINNILSKPLSWVGASVMVCMYIHRLCVKQLLIDYIKHVVCIYIIYVCICMYMYDIVHVYTKVRFMPVSTLHCV